MNQYADLVRRDTRERAKKEIEKNGGSAKGLWAFVNNINKPQKQGSIVLEEEGKIIEQESEVASIFNEHFINKVLNLKNNCKMIK